MHTVQMARSTLSVLYVDDEAEFLDLGKAFLEKDGLLHLTVATDATEGMRLISEHGFDAIISDYQMPSMDGIAFLRALRGQGDTTPFIIFTGKGREEVVIQALNEGADFFLQKGGNPGSLFAELAGKIRHAVEKRRADAALRESENRLRRAEEVAGFGHWEINLEEQTITGSPGAMALYGLIRPTYPLSFVQEIPLKEYRGRLDAALKNLIVRGERYDVQFKIRRRKDGKVLDIHSLAEYDAERKTVFGVLDDITEQAQALEAMREAQAQLRVAMDLAKLVRWEYDVAADTFTFDDQFYALFATTAEREGGTKMRSSVYAERFLPPEEAPIVAKEVEAALRTRDHDYSRQIEHDIIRRDGERRTITVVLRVVMDHSGQVIKTYGANQDITERKRAELSLHRANTKLDLLGGITRHDINNQITVLRGNLSLLREGITDSKMLSRLARMDNAAEEIEKRFQFVKEYQGSESEPPQWQSLSQLLERLPIGRNVDHLELSGSVRELEIRADPMLKIVFHNLLEDSIKYASKPVKVRIDCEKREKGVLLIYEDVGAGIPEGMKESIFIKDAGRGPGIGLFLCKQILSESNITIEEVGTPGEGARFEMLVPAAQCRTAH